MNEIVKEARKFLATPNLGKDMMRELDKALIYVRRLADALEAAEARIAKLEQGARQRSIERSSLESELFLFRHAQINQYPCPHMTGSNELDTAHRRVGELTADLEEFQARAEAAEARVKELEAKQPGGWSNDDAHTAFEEALARWSGVDERDVHNRNGFRLGAEWQKARETFISYKAIADEAKARIAELEAGEISALREARAETWDEAISAVFAWWSAPPEQRPAGIVNPYGVGLPVESEGEEA